MRLYLDNSFLNRPFDDSSVTFNRLEQEILFAIVAQVKRGEMQFVNSAVIEYENSLNPVPARKQFVKEVMMLASEYQDYTETVRQRAMTLKEKCSLTPFDARHLASAEVARVDLFITCDHALVKKYHGQVSVITPLTFYSAYANDDETTE